MVGKWSKYGDLKELWLALQPAGKYHTGNLEGSREDGGGKKKKIQEITGKLPAPDDNVNTSNLLGAGTVEALLCRLMLLLC